MQSLSTRLGLTPAASVRVLLFNLALTTTISSVGRKDLTQLWVGEAHGIRRYFRLALKDREIAEDLTAESFTQLAAAMERGAVDDPEALLRTIVKRRLVDEIRRRQSDPEVPSGDLYVDGDIGNLDPTRVITLDDAVFGDDFDLAVRELPKPERDAFILTELRGLSAHEAAPYLGVSQPTVSTRQRAALQSLRDALS